MTDEKTTTRRPGARTWDEAWTDEERAAIQEYRQQRRRSAGPGRGGKKAEADGEADVLAKIAQLDEPDHSMAERTPRDRQGRRARDVVPNLVREPRVLPGWTARLLLPGAREVQGRYAVLGFSDKAHLDDGSMWPVMYALPEMTAADEARITALVKKAVG